MRLHSAVSWPKSEARTEGEMIARGMIWEMGFQDHDVITTHDIIDLRSPHRSARTAFGTYIKCVKKFRKYQTSFHRHVFQSNCPHICCSSLDSRQCLTQPRAHPSTQSQPAARESSNRQHYFGRHWWWYAATVSEIDLLLNPFFSAGSVVSQITAGAGSVASDITSRGAGVFQTVTCV